MPGPKKQNENNMNDQVKERMEILSQIQKTILEYYTDQR